MTTLQVGSVFADRYEILATVGHGGMGSVYRARHGGLAKDVALNPAALLGSLWRRRNQSRIRG